MRSAAFIVAFGGLALLLSGCASTPESAPTGTEARVENCMEWRMYAMTAGVDPLQANEDDCRAAVLEDATRFTAPPTAKEWDAVAG